MTKRIESIKRLLGRKFSSRIYPKGDGNIDESSTLSPVVQLRNAGITPNRPTPLLERSFHGNNTYLTFTDRPTLEPLCLNDVTSDVDDGYVTTNQLNNILGCWPDVNQAIFIVDTRSLEDYKQCHVMTAVHVTQLADMNLDLYCVVILYDDCGVETVVDCALEERVTVDQPSCSEESFITYKESCYDTTRVDKESCCDTTRVDKESCCDTTQVDKESSCDTTRVDKESFCNTTLVDKESCYNTTQVDKQLSFDTTPVGISDHRSFVTVSSDKNYKELPSNSNTKYNTDDEEDTSAGLVARQQFTLLCLLGGYNLFFTRHPYYCTDQTVYDHYSSFFRYPSLILNQALLKRNIAVQGELYLGTATQAANSKVLSTLGITHVLNVTKEIPNVFCDIDAIQYLTIDVADENTENLLRRFPAATRFITEALFCCSSESVNVSSPDTTHEVFDQIRNNVLVHCDVGVSRSAVVVVAFLMKFLRLTLSDAFQFVKSRRPIVRPTRGYLNQLSRYEEMLFIRKHTAVERLYS